MLLNEYQPFYHRTLQELRESAAKNKEYVAKLQAEIRAVEARLDEIKETPKRCRFCGGQMLDLSPLNVDMLVQGAAATTLNHLRYSYGIRVPQSWECQQCRAFAASAPLGDIPIWTREDISPRSKSLAALIFEHFQFVDTVAYLNNSPYQRGWFLKTGGEWYYIEGPKDRVTEALGID